MRKKAVAEEFTNHYVVQGRFRKDEKFHCIAGAFGSITDLQTARAALNEAKRNAEWEQAHKRRKPIAAGGFGVECEYYSDYDLVEFRIRTRKVSKWTTVE